MDTAKTVIFGNGNITGQAARELLQNGCRVMIATSQPAINVDPATAELLLGVTLEKIKVAPQGYNLTFARGSQSILHQVARIVLCGDYQRLPEFERYKLTACDRVVSLSDIVAHPEEFSPVNGSIVFLSGIFRESNPLILRETMESAICLANDLAQKVYILTGNLKVAAPGLEALYREARQAGVTLVKFNREKPTIAQLKNGKATITFNDEITGHCFRLTPDLTVVDEILAVSEATAEAAGMLAIHRDLDGFAQTDNVHRLPILTNRRGILAAGPSRAVLDRDQQAMDVGNISLACAAPEDPLSVAEHAYAEINPGQCVRCLTCFRLCPFGAVVVGPGVHVAANMCEGCGICAAECPKGAIDMRQLSGGTPAEQCRPAEEVKTTDDYQPAMFAFCCSRSAVQAASLAGCLGHSLPPGLKIIKVPCAGAVSIADLLYAFQNKVDGVLVLTCHTGNCHAEEGDQHARRRVEETRKALTRIGLHKERLLRSTLAANMSSEFIETITGFTERLKQMGPLDM